MEKKYLIQSTNYHTTERQTKKGKVYDIRFWVVTEDGKKQHKQLSGFATKKLARQGFAEFVNENCEIVKGTPLRKVDAKKDELIFKELYAQYTQAIRNQLKDSTIYDKLRIFDQRILPEFGEMKMKDLTRERLLMWQDELWGSKNPKTGEYYSYRFLSRIRNDLSAFLSWCQERYPDGVHNYLLEIRKPKRRAPQKTMEFWTREEFEKFIAVVDNPMYHAMFTMFFFTGRRKGEVLALSPKDINLSKRAITFSKTVSRRTLDDSTYKVTSTKTERVSATPICETLYNELSGYEIDKNAKFYFGGDNPMSENAVWHAFTTYADKAGVKRIRIHDLRHSFVSMCIHVGATIPVVADLIGDTIAQVTKTYAHMYEDDKLNVIKNLH